MSAAPRELIVVRRLAQSDLGIFAAHRDRIASKQRAINFNAAIARQFLDDEILARGSVLLECSCAYRGALDRSQRTLKKTHKNWRLGGTSIAGQAFADVRAGDYALVRSVERNDGSHPVALGFVTAVNDRVRHLGLGELVNGALDGGMAAFAAGTAQYANYVHLCPREFIAVRSMAESDLGIFSVHRADLRCKQRAVNVNAAAARLMIDPAVFDQGGRTFRFVCRHQGREHRGERPMTKVGKNWRLGGDKLEGKEFARLDCKDFLLLRSFQWNDGSHPFALTFVGRKQQTLPHAGIAKLMTEKLKQSMAVVVEGDPAFAALATYCPPA